MPLRLSTLALLTLATALGAHDASALGFGRAQRSAMLGQPLDFSVMMRLDSGDVLLPQCVTAEVIVGDLALPQHAVTAVLEMSSGEPSIRVRTSSNIEEPIVGVTVIAGCESRMSRRFTLFADPPGMSSGFPLVADADRLAAPAPLLVPRETPAPPVRAASDPAAAAAPAMAAASSVSAAARPAPAAPKKARPVARNGTAQPAARSAPRLQLDAPVLTPGRVAAAAAAASAAAAAEQEALLRAAEQAASAASAAAAAAAASARVAALELSIESLKRDAQASREMMTRMTQALAESEQRGRWTPLLLAGLLLLLGAVAWLVLKLREARAEAKSSWWNAQAHPDSTSITEERAPDPLHASISRQGTAGASSDGVEVTAAVNAPAADAGPDSPPEVGAYRTSPMPTSLVASETPQRDVSIEELLDLEQQAEFFIVLGQDDAAIDLLVGHLRNTGGTSPLAYLKLLEIYRRRGDESAYERTRERFNQRFNAVAPAWATDLQAGRSLEDYPDVMALVQRSWPRPVDAMADLETLLFRTDGGTLFDLPAYREVLFLGSLARDLLEQDDSNAPRVDVLLPLADQTAFAATDARPFLSDDFGNLQPFDSEADARTTSAVDLDLTEPLPRVTSQFGSFDDKPSKPV